MIPIFEFTLDLQRCSDLAAGNQDILPRKEGGGVHWVASAHALTENLEQDRLRPTFARYTDTHLLKKDLAPKKPNTTETGKCETFTPPTCPFTCHPTAIQELTSTSTPLRSVVC